MFYTCISKHDFHTLAAIVEWNGALIRTKERTKKNTIIIKDFHPKRREKVSTSFVRMTADKTCIGIGFTSSSREQSHILTISFSLVSNTCRKSHSINVNSFDTVKPMKERTKTIHTPKSSPIYLSYLSLNFQVFETVTLKCEQMNAQCGATHLFLAQWEREKEKKSTHIRKQYELIRIKVEWDSCWHVASMPYFY